MPVVMTQEEAEKMATQNRLRFAQRRLTTEDVQHIRAAAAAGTKKAVLARMYGVAWNTIHSVVSGSHYRDVE